MAHQDDLPDFGLIEGKDFYVYLPLISSSWRQTSAAINEFNAARSLQQQLRIAGIDGGVMLSVPALLVRSLAQGAQGAINAKLNKALTALVDEVLEQIS